MWKPIAGLDGYFVNERGEILSKKTMNPRILKINTRSDGFLAAITTILGRKKVIYCHREVAKAFVPNPWGYQYVKHIDGNLVNNYKDNLCWCRLPQDRAMTIPRQKTKARAVTLESIVNQNEEGKMLVSGRMLHDFLEINRDFSNWIKQMIEYGFERGEDYFICSPNLASESRGGQNKKEYALTLDMAKEICMIQRSDKGRIARKYFIDCEKKLKAVATMPTLPDFTNPAEAAEAWAKQYRLSQEATKKLKAAKPKVDYYDKLVDTNHLTNLRDTAKELGVSQKQFIQLLLDKKFLYRDNGGRLKPYAARMEFFKVKEWTKGTMSGCQTFVTVKGKSKLRRLLSG